MLLGAVRMPGTVLSQCGTVRLCRCAIVVLKRRYLCHGFRDEEIPNANLKNGVA